MIINLTQHAATQEQKQAGVIDLKGDQLKHLKDCLTFESIPSEQEIEDRAHDIAMLARMNNLGGDYFEDPIFDKAMIGGAPFLMAALESALHDHYIQPIYAFSKRESVEKQIDGKIVKKTFFKHLGFVEVS